MSSAPMRIVIGAPATGDNFYPRDEIVQKLKLALAIEHVLFLAPRRTGKTSVLLHLQSIAPGKAVWLDLERFDHPSLWIKAMADELSKIQDPVWQRKLSQTGGFLERLNSEVVEITPHTWQEKANQLITGLDKLQEPIWFLMDEFPIMIDLIAQCHDVNTADAALHWLRGVRQQNPHSPVRFLLTGSIGLDSVLRRHGIRGSANDLRREQLTPLGKNEALAFALKLAHDNHIPLNEALALEFIDSLGPAIWPYFIQLFIAELQDHNPDPNHPADLDKIYRGVAHGQLNRNQYADNMWQRLTDIFNEAEASTARALLKLAAAHETGVALENIRLQLPNVLDEDLHHVLAVLQHDGYLIEDDNGQLRFFSHLLRDYWRHKNRL